MFTIVTSISAMKRPIIVTPKIGHFRAYNSSDGGLRLSLGTYLRNYPADGKSDAGCARGRDPALRDRAADEPLLWPGRSARERDGLARRGDLRRGRLELPRRVATAPDHGALRPGRARRGPGHPQPGAES